MIRFLKNERHFTTFQGEKQVNQSQANDPRFWNRWKNAGAVFIPKTCAVPEPDVVRTIPTEHASEGAEIAAVLAEIRAEYGYRIDFTMRRTWHESFSSPSPATITFGIKGRHRFQFWNSLSSRFDVIPAGHPNHPADEKAYTLLVNGSTNFIICGESITRDQKQGLRQLYSPHAARTRSDRYGYEWYYMTNPFSAEGQTFEIELNPTECNALTWQALKALLLAALNHGGKRIEINGGFNHPYDGYPSDLIPEPRLGSELDAIWQYLCLTRDGRLEGASIPPWLLSGDLFRRTTWLIQERTPELVQFIPA